MLAYRHQFHAGNFADVFKHVLLGMLVAALNRKPAPWFYLDTHAGLGRYGLAHPWSQKNREHEQGAAKVWRAERAPPPVEPWLAAVRAENPDGALAAYPGSPRLVRGMLRPVDRMVLCELQTADHDVLKALFRGDRRVAVHRRDGFEALKAFLPPGQARGLVLVDASFDRAGEFARLVDAVRTVHARWPTGQCALWYPRMDETSMREFARDLRASGVPELLRLELTVDAPHGRHMHGCGMVVCRPPYRFERDARAALEWLWPRLARGGRGGVRVDWLSGEAKPARRDAEDYNI